MAAALAPYAGHGLRLSPGVLRTPQPAALRSLEQRVRQGHGSLWRFRPRRDPGEGRLKIRLREAFRRSPEGQQAEAVLRSCVHCGFCNATCPTYLKRATSSMGLGGASGS